MINVKKLKNTTFYLIKIIDQQANVQYIKRFSKILNLKKKTYVNMITLHTYPIIRFILQTKFIFLLLKFHLKKQPYN